ncbi:hypothetical protein [Mycobacterium sp. IEC1808]|uniref:hypothetical protein n=1 Tax=Mycobacterium sp. IEC1808 TaxID=1743230 RepID=UPI00114D61B4|nr:hypothetical protein [Mycobacterium sp. IEC1808]
MTSNVCFECREVFQSPRTREYCSDDCQRIFHGKLTLAYSPPPTFRSSGPPAEQRLPQSRVVKPRVLEGLQHDRAQRPKRLLSVAEAWQMVGDADEVLPMDRTGRTIGFTRYK